MGQIFLQPRDTYSKETLQKKWPKTVIPALNSGQNNLHPAIWGCHHQLDDHHRNPNVNNRDHLVGQLTREIGALKILALPKGGVSVPKLGVGGQANFSTAKILTALMPSRPLPKVSPFQLET